jgi:hypothetical protein
MLREAELVEALPHSHLMGRPPQRNSLAMTLDEAFPRRRKIYTHKVL